MSAETAALSISSPTSPTPPPYLHDSPTIASSPPHPHPNTRYIGILHTGQSLSDGVSGDIRTPLPSLPYALKLHDSTNSYDLTADPNATSDTLSLVQLSEPIRPILKGAREWPENIEGVTPAEGFARQVDKLAAERDEEGKIITVHSVVGRAGEGMVGIKKGGIINSYAASLWEARAIRRLLGPDAEFSYDVILLTHGETDSWRENAGYMDEVVQLQKDYAVDLKEITGQTHAPFMLVTQQHTCVPLAGKIPLGIQTQWRVQAASEGRVVCVGPKYQYGYAEDLLHMPAGGYRRLGEKYAQVWDVLRRGRQWKPLSPRKMTREDDKIRVEMDVMFPPLRWDDHLPRPHQTGKFAAWQYGRGFEVRDGGAVGNVSIAKAEIEGENVILHLSDPQPAADAKLVVSYAMTPDEDGCNGGRGNGRIGHLCDSDPFKSASPLEIEVELVKGERAFQGGDEMLALYNLVTPGDYVLTEFDATKPDRGGLSRPWEGESGKHKLTFGHNQANYCVSFIGRVDDRPWENPFEGIEECKVSSQTNEAQSAKEEVVEKEEKPAAA